jgi:hypothetical protein
MILEKGGVFARPELFAVNSKKLPFALIARWLFSLRPVETPRKNNPLSFAGADHEWCT